MSLYEKLRNRRQTAASTPADTKTIEENTPPVPLPAEEPTVEEIVKPKPVRIGSEAYLLHMLSESSYPYPRDKLLVRKYLPKIQDLVKERMKEIELYEEWVSISSAPKETDPPVNVEDEMPSEEPPENTEDESTPDKPSENAQDELPPAEPPVPPLDAAAHIFITNDSMLAFLCVLAPVGDGEPVNDDLIYTALEENMISYGVNHELISRITSEQLYYQIIPIARGLAPVKGQPGKVTERYSRVQEIHLTEDEKGVIDFKDLDIFQNVKVGDIICDIVLPTDGTPGCTLMGNEIPAEKGDMPPIPKGKNTELNEDQTALVALIVGDLTFQKGGFRVQPQLVIPHDVDGSTGNISFEGDILVMGDVLNGFRVEATGNVHVQGMATGAVIIAGEDIEVKKGVNGGKSGEFQAGGDVSSRYLEQIKITAQGSVSSEAIINCQITCGGNIQALSGRGSIVGGTLMTSQSIEAKKIGNLSNTKTIIKIGHALSGEDNETLTMEELKSYKETYAKICQNIKYLSSRPTLPDEKVQLLEVLKEQEGLYQRQIQALYDKLELITLSKPQYEECHVWGDVIYGITEVSLGSYTISIRDTTSKCNIYYEDEELAVGTY